MSVKQISVFIENKSGQISEVSAILADSGVNLRALSIADTQDFGILRIIVENPEAAIDILRNAGYTCKTTTVLAVEIADEPGSLAKVMGIVSGAGIDIEYAYAFIGKTGKDAYMIFRVNDNEKAAAILFENGISVASAAELF